MTRRIWLMLLLLAVGLAGTATAADRPAWVDGESDEWPRSKFLTGVGSADERGVAESRARAELARVFQARVESEISSQEFESVRSSGADTQSRRGMDARDVTQVVTTGELVARPSSPPGPTPPPAASTRSPSWTGGRRCRRRSAGSANSTRSWSR